MQKPYVPRAGQRQKDHDLGPPHIWAFLGFIGGLLKNHETDVGKKNAEVLRTWQQQISNLHLVSSDFQDVKSIKQVLLPTKILADAALLTGASSIHAWAS